MRNYWRGNMNWPVVKEWKCETCGHAGTINLVSEKHPNLKIMNNAMTFGLVRGECRCNVCHTPYKMVDGHRTPVTTPINKVKPEYRLAVIALWERTQCKVDEMELNALEEVLKEGEI